MRPIQLLQKLKLYSNVIEKQKEAETSKQMVISGWGERRSIEKEFFLGIPKHPQTGESLYKIIPIRWPESPEKGHFFTGNEYWNANFPEPKNFFGANLLERIEARASYLKSHPEETIFDSSESYKKFFSRQRVEESRLSLNDEIEAFKTREQERQSQYGVLQKVLESLRTQVYQLRMCFAIIQPKLLRSSLNKGSIPQDKI